MAIRELNTEELNFVSGGADDIPPELKAGKGIKSTDPNEPSPHCTGTEFLDNAYDPSVHGECQEADPTHMV